MSKEFKNCSPDTMLTDLTREELFLLIWERPSQEIAQELGISDVALAS